MPQPVDLQTEIGRVTTAERIQEIAGRASLAALQRQTGDLEESRVQLETQVQQTEQSRNERIDAEGRRKNPFVGRKRTRKKDSSKTQSDTATRMVPSDGQDHHLDVTI